MVFFQLLSIGLVLYLAIFFLAAARLAVKQRKWKKILKDEGVLNKEQIKQWIIHNI